MRRNLFGDSNTAAGCRHRRSGLSRTANPSIGQTVRPSPTRADWPVGPNPSKDSASTLVETEGSHFFGAAPASRQLASTAGRLPSVDDGQQGAAKIRYNYAIPARVGPSCSVPRMTVISGRALDARTGHDNEPQKISTGRLPFGECAKPVSGCRNDGSPIVALNFLLYDFSETSAA